MLPGVSPSHHFLSDPDRLPVVQQKEIRMKFIAWIATFFRL